LEVDPKCTECLFNDWIGFDDPPRSCKYCLSTRERENFVSIYKEKPKPIIVEKKKSKRKPRKIEEKPPHPKRREDDPNRLYKVLYSDPVTGDWFYEFNRRDMIGHYANKRVDDIQDVY